MTSNKCIIILMNENQFNWIKIISYRRLWILINEDTLRGFWIIYYAYPTKNPLTHKKFSKIKKEFFLDDFTDQCKIVQNNTENRVKCDFLFVKTCRSFSTDFTIKGDN